MVVSWRERRARTRTVAVLLLTTASVLGVTACGSDDSAADIESRIARERADAAQQARQQERVKELEREVERLKKRTTSTKTVVERAAPGGSSPSPASSSQSGSWPANTSAWTVVLVSAGSQEEAQATASKAGANGLTEVGTLLSSEHSSLRAGYWVAYSGVLSRSAAAERQTQARAAGFPQAYARYVSSR